MNCDCKKRNCKICKSQYNKKHYLENKQKYVDKAKRNNRRYKARNREFVYQYLLTHPCVDCGESNPVRLEFDHFRDKKGNTSDLTKQACSLNRLREEMVKCDVRCASCHREKTARDGHHWIFKRHHGSLA